MRRVALVAIDAITNIVEILFLIWVQVPAPLKRVDGFKGFAKCDPIAYSSRKINSGEVRVGLREGLRKEGHIGTLRQFRSLSSLNRRNIYWPCQAFEIRELGVDAGLALSPFTS